MYIYGLKKKRFEFRVFINNFGESVAETLFEKKIFIQECHGLYLHVCFRHQSLQFLLFSLCRRFYKEEEELVLDVGPFAKALEVLKTMNNLLYIYSDINHVLKDLKQYSLTLPGHTILTLEISHVILLNYWNEWTIGLRF